MDTRSSRDTADTRRLMLRRGGFAGLTLALAYGGGLWIHLMHEASGAVEPGAPPPLIHWLRDSTLLVPFIAIALVGALFVARRLLRPRSSDPVRVTDVAAVVAITAFATSFVEGLLTPLHGIAFGGHEGHGAELPVVEHMLRDGMSALPANLAVAAAVVLALGGRMWLARDGSPFRLTVASAVRRGSVLFASASLAATSIMAPIAPAVALAASSSPCPTTTIDKSFEVSAIDIEKMWLNRFGDYDPHAQMYTLTSNVAAVQAQVKAGPSSLSIGLRDDLLQPLVVRANEGDCVQITFHNDTKRPAPGATNTTLGMHVAGLSFATDASGDDIGNNAQSAVEPGGTAIYTWYIPNDKKLEGAHLIQPGPGNRQAVAHGLFGVLAVEPPHSTYLNPTTGVDQPSGFSATIVPGTGKSFREDVIIFHEIGNESERGNATTGVATPLDLNGDALPTIDPHTGAYRPGSRALNYRTEPFMDRLEFADDQKSQTYGSYTFADTTNIMPRGYLGDPTKFRLVHAGSEVFHVFHLHGGADRWRFDPIADPTFDYADTGLKKMPPVVQSQSDRLDSQTIGPGESYNLEIENGAGGAQQGAGEFLFHCHIAHHYFAGMWGIWRVYDTLQPDLAPLPDRTMLAKAVTSADLVNKTINGQKITSAKLDGWIRPQLPTQGVTKTINAASRDDADQDASVWDWTIDSRSKVYLGEADRDFVVPSGPLQGQLWPDFEKSVTGHPSALLIDSTSDSLWKKPDGTPVHFDAGGYIGNRPKILFNPVNGRPAWPLLRPHIGKRPPFAPNGHSGAPYLGETANQKPAKALSIDPWANRDDGICPAWSPKRTYNVVGITLPITITDPTKLSKVVDPLGALDVLAEDKASVYAGTKSYAGDTHPEPLAIRANIGDCVAVTYTSELKDGGTEVPFSKTNIHIHHVQFDTQGSDGVVTGFSYEQSIRPYKIVDPQLTAAAAAKATTLQLTSVAKFQPGVSIGVGLGTNGIEIHQIKSINTSSKTLTLNEPLINAHPANEWAGTEFVQYRWYPDVALDNIFFHDHVNGIHGWSHGMVGQLIVEPQGSRYFDPVSGQEIRAGARADIHTDPTCVARTTPSNFPPDTSNQCKLIPGVVDGSYREYALWDITSHEPLPVDSVLNLRAEPFADRTCTDASQRYSSSCGGDPYTPIMRAYAGDPIVIRNLDIGQGTKTLDFDGQRTSYEPRYREGGNGAALSSPIDTIHSGVSERFTLVLRGGAGGPNHVSGDFLYSNGETRRLRSGAWGILRVLPSVDTSVLKPLPDHQTPDAQLPTCPNNRAPDKTFDVSAVDIPSSLITGDRTGRLASFVPTSLAAAVINKTLFPEPLVLHVAADTCFAVRFTNQRATQRASFHDGVLLHDQGSAGINVGQNTGDQSVAPGGTRTYTFYADTEKLGATMVEDFGGATGSVDGLYGSIVVSPVGSTFADPATGNPVTFGSKVIVHAPNEDPYRDFTLLLADQDERIGQDTMPYPKDVVGPAFVNYRQATGRADTATQFSSLGAGDPPTPLLRAYAGDPVEVHVLGAAGSEQSHVFSLGGMRWFQDKYIGNSSTLSSRDIGPHEKMDLEIQGGAGGDTQQPGDYFYGDVRRPFTEAGMWGLFRVLPNSCATGGVVGLICVTAGTATTALGSSLASTPTGGLIAGTSGGGVAAAPAGGGGTGTTSVFGTIGSQVDIPELGIPAPGKTVPVSAMTDRVISDLRSVASKPRWRGGPSPDRK